ncbi:ABC transporter ATP-binding protein [Oceanobacillus caeni]|uniref:ABC transporter ATP-binding protein n=1 Tax=Oceanobacillus caeni TaxID=405946 RepID=UPI001C23AE7D|nr:ABC transporter ATP-binding protein [Oceanobacillus caeni]MCR1832838.1 ABC transporter ATP-binding protein [Oceanobacillus caeni]
MEKTTITSKPTIRTPLATKSVSVELKQLVKKFPSMDGGEDFVAVDQLNLKIDSGELVTLLGPSGCGKTTTLRMLAGFEFPTSGSILVGDKDISNVAPNKRNIGMVFQSYALFPHLTVFENVAYGLNIKKVNKKEMIQRTNTVLEIMHLEKLKDRPPSQLSGGQQQRVALARAIVTEPNVLLFDEPLSNLDAKLREYMRDELRKIQQRLGITSLYVTHDQTEAMAISDKVVIMNQGQLQQADSPQNIYIKPKNHFVADFMGKANFIPATIKDCDANTIRIIILNEEITVINNVNFSIQKGQIVDCVVRPEFWKIDNEGKFNGIVRNATYFGNSVEYEIEINGFLITVSDYEHVKNGMKFEGDTIRLYLEEECVSLLEEGRKGV